MRRNNKGTKRKGAHNPSTSLAVYKREADKPIKKIHYTKESGDLANC